MGILAAKAQSKGLELRLTCEPQMPEIVIGDGKRLQQVLMNLIGNAIKFTDTGGVRVHAAVLRQEKNEVELQFDIIDSGIGIPAEKMDRLFKHFSQVDSSTARTHGGTGLGLVISKNLVRLMGGTITVMSRVNEETCFRFNVVLALPENPQLETPISKNSPGTQTSCLQPRENKAIRILVAEDNRINQIVIKGILDAAGIDCDIVDNGQDAFDRATTSRFDLILMDCQMPIVDGYQVTQMLREYERQESIGPIPIIALTANAVSGDKEKCLEAGMNAYCSKPVDAKRLLETIDQFLLGVGLAATPAER